MSEQLLKTQHVDDVPPPAENPVELAIKMVQEAAQPAKAEEKPAPEPEKVVAAETQEAAPAPEPDKALEEIKSLLNRDNKASKAKREAAEARAKIVEELKGKAVQDRAGFLRELGLNPRDFVADVLMGHQPEPEEEKPSPQLEKLYKEVEALKGALVEKQTQEQQAYIAAQQREAVNSAKQFVTESGDKYEMIRAAGEQGLQFLVDVLVAKYNENRDYYVENNTAPGFQDVAEGVEKYLYEQAKQQLEWVSKQSKLQPLLREFAGRLGNSQPAAPKQTSKPLSLDNDLAAEGADSVTPKTADERAQLAVKKLESLMKQAA